VPFWSKTFLPWPWETLGIGLTSNTVLTTAIYWVLPVAICVTILARHSLFVLFFVLECGAFIFHSVAESQGQPLKVQIAPVTLVGFLATLGLIFARLDFIFPFLSKRGGDLKKMSAESGVMSVPAVPMASLP